MMIEKTEDNNKPADGKQARPETRSVKQTKRHPEKQKGPQDATHDTGVWK